VSEGHRYQAVWRSLIFNRVYDNSGLVDEPAHLVAAFMESDYRLTSLDLTRVETVDYREQRQWLEGGEANEAYEGVMVGIGDGIIHATTHADLGDKTSDMRAAFSVASCRIAAVNLDPPGVLPFDFRRDTAGGNLPLRLYARPASGRPVIIGRQREGLSRRFRFSLVAFDPKLYSQTEYSVSCATAGPTTLVNAGTLPTQPTLVVVCNAGANLFIKINGSATLLTLVGMAAGTWTLDCKRSTITKADGTNGYVHRPVNGGYLSTLYLGPGTNSFDTTSSSGLTSVTAKFRDAYA
jgi:hypothetical protein